MIGEVLYVLGKIYFSIAGIFYIYSILTGHTDLFTHVTGIVAIIFLISNIKWYFFHK